MSDSPVVGSASFELRATKDKFKADLRESEADLKRSVGVMEQDAGAGASKIGGAISSLALTATTAITALVTVLGLAAVGAFNLGMQGLRMGDDIANSARKIGVGTNALQEWRFVAQQTGSDAKAADASLDKFADKLAQATAGTSKSASKAFNLIDLGPNQLKGFKSTEDALDVVAEKIRNLKTEAERSAVIDALGLDGLSNALRDGAVDIEKLRNEAHDLGVVMDQDMIQRASRAQGELDTLSQVIDVNLKSAFIDLAPAIITAIGLVADLAKALADAMNAWRDLENKTSRGLQQEAVRLSAENTAMINRYGSVAALPKNDPEPALGASGGAAGPGGAILIRSQQRGSLASFQENQQRIDTIFKLLKEREAVSDPGRSDRSTGSSVTLPPPRQRVDRSAEREARRAERVEQEIYKARQRLLNIAEDDELTAQQRFDLSQEQLKLERSARDAEIASKNTRGEILDEERDALNAANAEADALEDRILTQSAWQAIEDERLANERLLSGLTADLLSLQSSAARTAKERQRIELELLEITQKQRRDALQLQLDRDPSLTSGQRADAMATNGRIDSAEREAVARNNLSPLAAWRDESLKTADEIAEAYENVAARGLDSLNDGITDAILNSRSLGEVFTNVANSIISDLARIAIRQSITEPLANWLFGNGKSSGNSGAGNLLSSIGSFFSGGGRIPGFSSGVTNFSGGLAYVHAGEMLTNLAPGTNVIPAHTVSAMGKGNGPYFDLRGAVMTQDLLEQMNQIGRTSESRANHWSTTNVPGLSQSQTAKQQQHTVGRKKR